jgi:hypothetical protein
MLNALDQEMTEQVNTAPLIDCEDNDLFRFLADLGELGASHPHLTLVRDVIGTMLMNIQGQGRVDYYLLRSRVHTPRLYTILFYLQELGLVRLITEGSRGAPIRLREVLIPQGTLIQKAFMSLEAFSAWEEHREPNLILSYIVIKGLVETLKIIEMRGGPPSLGEGITRLYAVSGKVIIPKQFTAPLLYILGSWAQGHDEFTETDLTRFLAARGFTGSERDRVVRIIAGTQPGLQHTIYRLERFSYGDQAFFFRFVLNPRFRNLRDRVRLRVR